VDPTNGRTPVTTLVSGEHDPTWDAGIYRPVIIGDTIWLDSDHDGVQDEGEPGIPGVVLDLYDSNGENIGETTTDESGHYQFDDTNTTGLPPDTDYEIRLDDPANFEDDGPLADHEPTEVGQGEDGTDSDIEIIDSVWIIKVTTPEDGGTDVTFDGGVYAPGVGDLAIEKSVVSTPQQVADTGEIKWEVFVANVGTAVIDGPITAIDQIPNNQRLKSATGEGWTCVESDNLVQCETAASVEMEKSLPVITVVTEVVTESSVYDNTAEVSAAGDTDDSNNVASAEISMDGAVANVNEEKEESTPRPASPANPQTPIPAQLSSTDKPLAKTGAMITAALIVGLLSIGGGLLLVGSPLVMRRRRGDSEA
jgi:hypothetical protein